jgi:hypothetical protein
LPNAGIPEIQANPGNTPFSVWQAIAKCEIEGLAALLQGKYTVTGDFSLKKPLRYHILFRPVQLFPTPEALPLYSDSRFRRRSL